MLKRISSLVLVLVVAGSVFAVNVRLERDLICKLTGMPMTPNMAHMRGVKMAGGVFVSSLATPDMDTGLGSMSCDTEQVSDMDMGDSEILSTDLAGMETILGCDDSAGVSTQLTNDGECCFTIPHEPGATETTLNLRPTYSSFVISDPALTRPLFFPTSRDKRPFMTQLFLPNFQASYLFNLSFLI